VSALTAIVQSLGLAYASGISLYAAVDVSPEPFSNAGATTAELSEEVRRDVVPPTQAHKSRGPSRDGGGVGRNGAAERDSDPEYFLVPVV